VDARVRPAMIHKTRSGSSRRWQIPAVLALVLGLAVIGLGVFVGSGPDVDGRINQGSRLPGAGVTFPWEAFLQDPIDGGSPVTIDEAQESVSFSMSIPSDALANSDNIEGVWASEKQVALAFTTGIVIIEESPQFPDSLVEFQGLMADSLSGVKASIDYVGKYPALLIEANSDITSANPSSLQFVAGDVSLDEKDGVSITIYGKDISTVDLLDIATTLT
jgi:hypothetical protein